MELLASLKWTCLEVVDNKQAKRIIYWDVTEGPVGDEVTFNNFKGKL